MIEKRPDSQTNLLVQRNSAESRVQIAMRDSEIVELKRQGKTFREIAKQFGLSLGATHKAFERHLRRIPAMNVAQYRDEQLARISMMREEALDVMAERHYMVSNGQVVHLTVTSSEGVQVRVPLADPAPRLQALDRLIKLDEQEAKLMGLYPDPRTRVDGQIHFTLGGVDDSALT